MSKPISFINYCKRLVAVMLIVLLAACAQEPPKELPLSQWTTEQLVVKGRSEFEATNYNNAARYLKEAADRDDPEALYALGYMYYYGNGVARDPNMAQDLIRRSAAFGHKPAIKALRLFIANKSTFTVDPNESAYLASNKPADANSTKLAIATIDSENTLSTRLETVEPSNQDENNSVTHSVPVLPNFVALDNKATPTQAVKPEQLATIVAVDKTDTPVAGNTHENVAVLETAPKNKLKRLKRATTKTDKLDNETALLNQELLANDSTVTPDNNSSKKDIVQKQTQIALDQNRTQAAELNDVWLRKQNPASYTVQITAKKSLAELHQYLNANNLTDKAKVFTYLYKNEIWYGAGVGVYQKPSQAYQAMLNDRPRGINTKAKTSKPWVRQFKNIQDVG